MGNLFRKCFMVDLENALTYPTTTVICETLERTQGDIEFITAGTPVIFKIKDGTFQVEVRMDRGGYGLFCREVKEDT